MKSFAEMQHALEAMLSDSLLTDGIFRDSEALYDEILRMQEIPFELLADRLREAVGLNSPESLTPKRAPIYWSLMSLVGSYIRASDGDCVRASTVFLTGMIVREYVFAHPPSDLSPSAATLLEVVRDSYKKCGSITMTSGEHAAERLQIKSSPWSVILAAAVSEFGPMRRRRGDTPGTRLAAAAAAVYAVYSCLQMVDEWNDRAEDQLRGHWNLWNYEIGLQGVLLAIASATTAFDAVSALVGSTLRSVLALQLRDTLGELAKLATEVENGSG